MYNVSQQPASQSLYSLPQQSQTQTPYDSVAPYQSRLAPGAEALSSQYGVPPQYYSAGDAPPSAAPTAIPQAYQTAAYQQSLQYNSSSTLDRSTLASPYPAVSSELSQVNTGEENVQQNTDVAAENNARYYRAIGETNESTYRGMLVQAGVSLLEITEWLLPNAVPLGTV